MSKPPKAGATVVFQFMPSSNWCCSVSLTGKNRSRVFTAQKGGVLRPDNVRWVLIKQVIEPLANQFPSEKEEIGFKDGRLHSLRHFFCSVCAHSQIPEQVVMRWLGHRDSKMVRRYYHLHDEESQRS